MTQLQPGLGAFESLKDYRTIESDAVMAVPLTTGGFDYLPEEIEHQHKVGICCAISIVQMAQKYHKTKYSPDFFYLVMKKFIDQNWIEGSSLFTAVKAANKYGFLPIEDFVYIKENDRNLSYQDYILKLQAIPEEEINRLLALCEYKLPGYTRVDTSVPEKIAAAIQNSDVGILTRYNVGSEWWTPSWDKKDINPLKAPKQTISGHAIIGSLYRFNEKKLIRLSNTWGTGWCDLGEADTYHEDYPMQEAWIPHFSKVPDTVINRPTLPKHQPITRNLYLSSKGDDVMRLQSIFKLEGLADYEPTGYFGYKTLASAIAYQKKYGITPTLGYVFEKTR